MEVLLFLSLALAFCASLRILKLRREIVAQASAFIQVQGLLEEGRDRLQLALDGADEALWDWDVKQQRTYYSDRWSQMLGFTSEEIGSSVGIWERLMHPDDLADSIRKLASHMEGQSESYQAEFRMKTKEGGWRWIQARGRVVKRL